MARRSSPERQEFNRQLADLAERHKPEDFTVVSLDYGLRTIAQAIRHRKSGYDGEAAIDGYGSLGLDARLIPERRIYGAWTERKTGFTVSKELAVGVDGKLLPLQKRNVAKESVDNRWDLHRWPGGARPEGHVILKDPVIDAVVAWEPISPGSLSIKPHTLEIVAGWMERYTAELREDALANLSTREDRRVVYMQVGG